MIEVAHRQLQDAIALLERDTLAHASLDMESYIKFLSNVGKYQGLNMALSILENLMRGVESDGPS